MKYDEEEQMRRLWQLYQSGELALIVFHRGLGEQADRDAYDTLIAKVRQP